MSKDRDRGETRRATKTLALVGLVLALVGLAAAGCSREARFEVLTFFFTGVPPLDGETEVAAPEPAAERKAAIIAGAKARHEEIKAQRKQKQLARRQLPWTHGPFAAGECTLCHAIGASKQFGGLGGLSAAAVKGGSSFGPRLSMPLEELCLTCHAEKSTVQADALDLRLHGPVASGRCIACHGPHASKRRFLLQGKDNVEMCSQCHDTDGIRQRSPVHATEDGKADCVTCHNPHRGRTAMILRSDYDELGAQE